MTLVFSISGIAVNHNDDWNPNYKVTSKTIVLEGIAEQINSTTLEKYLKEHLDISSSTRATFWETKHRYKLF